MRTTTHWATTIGGITTGGLLATLLATGCVSLAEGHCGNAASGTVCGGQTPHCSVCQLDNDGCVAEVPAMECRAAAPEDPSTSTGEDADSTTAQPECSGSGLDDGCPASTPYCVDETCQSCADQGAEYCGGLDGERPVCEPSSGTCVECTAAQPLCGDAEPLCAPDLVCSGCWKHEQCPDSACDLSSGECMPSTSVVWVDAAACPGPGTGTEADPYCRINDALDHPGEMLTLWVRPGSYVGRVVLTGTEVAAIRGQPGSGRVELSAEAYEVVSVTSSAMLFLESVDILDTFDEDNTVGAECAGLGLWMEDVNIRPHRGGGVLASDTCRVQLYRSQVIDRDGNAIRLLDRARLSLRSSVVGLNGQVDMPTHAIDARGQSTFEIAYSTVAGNRGLEPSGSISCSEESSGTVRNSIVASFTGNSIDCANLSVERSVVDTAVGGTNNTEVSAISPSWFVDVTARDFHVADPAQTPFLGVAQWLSGDPYEDLAGPPRVLLDDGTAIVGADVP
ncbi:MAG: right-handed parallel beta-helix repeat-containing protein [Nannocystaceae bacterium]